MHMNTKIATCSYCGTRQLLRLTARSGHELACSACGAPLHEMKWLKANASGNAKPSPRRSAPHGGDLPGSGGKQHHPPKKHRSRKRRKPMWQRMAEEAFDLIEDIID